MGESVLAQLIAPQNNCCHLCGRLLHSHELYLCEDCLQDIYRSRIMFPERKIRLNDALVVYSACWYEKRVRSLIQDIKYHHDPFLAEIAGYVLGEVFVEQNILQHEYPLVIPVPTHAKRLEERGYNQAELIAKVFARTAMLDMDANLVERTRFTGSQVKRNRNERLQAMKDAFQPLGSLKGRQIILVDDVLTTGATITACAEALMKGGASSVTGFTVCRA